MQIPFRGYFILRGDSDPKTIGIRDGSSQAILKEGKFLNGEYYKNFVNFFRRDDFSHYWTNLGQFPDFEFELEYVQLQKKAKPTDFLSYFPDAFTGGRLVLVILTALVSISCARKPKVYEGEAEVFVKEGNVITDSLKTCFCWVEDDSFYLEVTNVGYAGIALRIKSDGVGFEEKVEYWSDADEFDGNYIKQVKVQESDLKMTFHQRSDTLSLDAEIFVLTYGVDDQTQIKLQGSSKCYLKIE